MKHAEMYLKQNVQVEPLIDQWYAWSHLLPPATYARNMTERHFRIMDSYVSAPQIHASAVRNPKMLGGPFIDYQGKRTDEIIELKNRTKQDRKKLIDLSSALEQLDAMLRTEAKGASLQPLYEKIPSPLRGYVELTYTAGNSPTFRLIESLLYRSEYFEPKAQSLLLSSTNGDERPFVLSTPRLHDPETVQLQMPFRDSRLDQLFKMKNCPCFAGDICEVMEIAAPQQASFKEFLTQERPAKYTPYGGRGIRWRYFGHACILIETKDLAIMFDPVLSYTYESSVSRYTYLDLPDHIDYVVITHNHQDHILFETLLQLRHKIDMIVVPKGGTGTLVDPSLRLTLQSAGFANVVELGELDALQIPGGEILGLPFLGEHADLFITTKLAYLVRFGKESLLFAADSCNIDHELYRHIHREIGDISVLFLGMECDGAPLSWLYGPVHLTTIDRGFDESRRLSGSNYDQAALIVSEFHCKEVYVYAMGQEPWLNYIMSIKYTDQSRPIVESNRLLEKCGSEGIVAERLFGEKEILIDCSIGE